MLDRHQEGAISSAPELRNNQVHEEGYRSLQIRHATTDSLPAPDVLTQEFVDDLEAALEQFSKIAARLTRKAEVKPISEGTD